MIAGHLIPWRQDGLTAAEAVKRPGIGRQPPDRDDGAAVAHGRRRENTIQDVIEEATQGNRRPSDVPDNGGSGRQKRGSGEERDREAAAGGEDGAAASLRLRGRVDRAVRSTRTIVGSGVGRWD